ncbi:MAG: phosphomethylpyrimidine synthase ThiC [Deltaproteobacteria bacterium]
MTQFEYARAGRITPLMKKAAAAEGVSAEKIRASIAAGKTVIPANSTRKLGKPCAIGEGLKTKINANIGTSTDKASLSEELRKLAEALKYGADAMMDLSVGGDLPAIRRKIIAACDVPLGTVPVYEISVNAQRRTGDPLDFAAQDIFPVLESQAAAGVDFFTIHCGVTRKTMAALRRKPRLMGVVSRGGAILAAWMARTGKENPFFEHFDRILDIASRYDVTLSLGDGLRPGSVLDATDAAQLSELALLGKLAKKAQARGVQVMIEGPGHVPLDQVRRNMLLEKKLCHGAPFYVLGPLVTDIAAGYDHISGAIGGCLAAMCGADFLCYVTPAEHLRHPSLDDVREGVIASKIAAHGADIAKGVKGAIEKDRRMSEARRRRDWKAQIALSIDPVKAARYRRSSMPGESDVCTMCGKFCSIKMMERCSPGKKARLRV